MASKSKQDILSLIEADHRKVEELFDEFEELEGKQAQECFKQIYKELTLHAKVEELVFYPALREYEETESYIEEAESEHNSVKILLEQMKSLKPTDSEFETKMMHLQESVTHHVEEEEDETFEAVRNAMDEAELRELGEEFQAAKAKMETEVEAMAGMKSK
jgi:hemerythrin superfamily protein